MSKKLNDKAKLYLVATVIAVALVSIGVALAYFAADIQGEGVSNLNVSVSKNPFLTFTPGDGLLIEATLENFQKGKPDLFDSTTSTATLEADGTSVSANYNVYFKINQNGFKYSDIQGKQAELVLVITTTDGSDEDSLPDVVIPEGHTAKTFTIKNKNSTTGEIYEEEVIGIDITEEQGLIKVKSDHEIIIPDGDAEFNQEWNATLYFINLTDVNQIENSGKAFSAQFILGEIPLTLSEKILINNGADKGPASSLEQAISYIESKPNPQFEPELSEEWDVLSGVSSDEGMFATEDINGGNSYYFRGLVKDNYVNFAGETWRIVRVDEDGNVRMIQEVPAGDEAFNYNYDYPYSQDFETAKAYSRYDHKTDDGKDSTIKQFVDDYYNREISNFESKLVKPDFCINSSGTLNEFGVFVFNAGIDFDNFNGNTLKPTLKCETTDIFAGSYTGLLSIAEFVFSGFVTSELSSDYYLASNNNPYWTLTPLYMDEIIHSSDEYDNWGYQPLMALIDNGFFGSEYINFYRDPVSVDVRIVIALKGDTIDFSGNGTVDEPYRVN